MLRIKSTISALAVAASVVIVSTGPSHAFGGSINLGPLIAAVNAQKAALMSALNAQQLAVVQTLGLLGGQLSGNLKSQIAAEANMRQLEDERARQREIERVKFDAIQRNADTSMECRIITRVRRQAVFNRPDLMVSEATLEALEQLATFDRGEPVGPSPVPASYNSPASKEAAFKAQLEQAFGGQDVSPEITNLTVNPARLLSSDVYTVPADAVAGVDDPYLEACKYMAKHLTGPFGESLDNVAAKPGNSDASLEVASRNASTARKSMAQKYIMQACALRSAHAAKNDSSTSQILSMVEDGDLGGYTPEQFPNGLSWRMAFQMRSQEWYANIKEISESTNEIDHLKAMRMTTAWLAYQNNEIWKKLDDLTTLQAAQLGVATEALDFQKAQAKAE